MSTAERIAAHFGDDGQNWIDGNGESLGDYVTPYAETTDHDDQRGTTRVQFADGSAIVMAGAGWDLGFSAPATCHCWQGAGHNCEDADDYGRVERRRKLVLVTLPRIAKILRGRRGRKERRHASLLHTTQGVTIERASGSRWAVTSGWVL